MRRLPREVERWRSAVAVDDDVRFLIASSPPEHEEMVRRRVEALSRLQDHNRPI